MTNNVSELTDLHRKLGRLHRELDLARPAITMTIQGKTAATMVRVAQQTIATALSASGHGIPKRFTEANECAAIEIARYAISHLEGMTNA